MILCEPSDLVWTIMIINIDFTLLTTKTLPTALTSINYLIFAGLLSNGYVLKNSASSDLKPEKKTAANSQVAANEYDEIDQIYDYVRGLAELPKNLNNFEFISETATPYAEPKLPHHPSNFHHPHKDVRDVSKMIGVGSMRSSNNFSKTDTNFLNSSQWIKHELMEKPIPPSLKTIPSKKQQHPRRPTLVFGKNNCSTHCPKISSPQKEVTEMSPQSPLFHIR